MNRIEELKNAVDKLERLTSPDQGTLDFEARRLREVSETGQKIRRLTDEIEAEVIYGKRG